MLYIYTGVGKQTLHRLCRPRGGVLTLTDPRGGHFLNWPTGTLWSADRADSADVVYTHAACILIIDDDDDDIIRDYLAIIAISLCFFSFFFLLLFLLPFVVNKDVHMECSSIYTS